MRTAQMLITTLLLVLPALGQYQKLTVFKAPGSDPGGNLACAVNNQGEAAADALFGGARRSFTVKNGEFEFLPIPVGYDFTGISGINERGDVIGASVDASGVNPTNVVGTIWRGGYPELITPPQPTQPGNPIAFRPFGINNSGVMIGQVVERTSASPQQFRVTAAILRNHVYEALPPPVVSQPLPQGINNRGDILVSVIGNLATDGFVGVRYYVYRNNAYIQVDAPPETAQLNAINEQGAVLGHTANFDWLYISKGQTRIIPKPVGASVIRGLSLNNKGEACGNAFSYTPQGGLVSYLVITKLQ